MPITTVGTRRATSLQALTNCSWLRIPLLFILHYSLFISHRTPPLRSSPCKGDKMRNTTNHKSCVMCHPLVSRCSKEIGTRHGASLQSFMQTNLFANWANKLSKAAAVAARVAVVGAEVHELGVVRGVRAERTRPIVVARTCVA
jgi:hypothetical protein